MTNENFQPLRSTNVILRVVNFGVVRISFICRNIEMGELEFSRIFWKIQEFF